MKDNATQKRTVNNGQEKQHSFCECVTSIQNHISKFQPNLQITDGSN